MLVAVGIPDSHRLPAFGEVVDHVHQRFGHKIVGMVVHEELHGIEQGAAAEFSVRLGEELRTDMQREARGCQVLAGDDVALPVGGGEFLGLVRVHGEPTENDLGFAARIGEFAVSSASSMTAFVIRELEDGTAAILDRVDSDFVLSVGENDRLAHDFGWVVNRVSCRPGGPAHLVGLTRI